MRWLVCRINGGYRLRPYLLGDSGYAISPWLIILVFAVFPAHRDAAALQRIPCFRVSNEASHNMSDSDVGKETRLQLGQFLALH
ncbi:hypothetical protein R1sor_005017 [Riccia sorocarpa]|uniref:DDE Tnp4 domain-containing protein n=1 Tax=Riccia sorocarpa TaxID=122646 RepID=A0ABD3HKC5_9MARC